MRRSVCSSWSFSFVEHLTSGEREARKRAAERIASLRVRNDMVNVNPAVVADFGREWTIFDQSDMPREEALRRFNEYFGMFRFDADAEGFDLGCGSGRWSVFVAPMVAKLHCIDPSAAIEVARRNLSRFPNVSFSQADADHIPLKDESQDFGYCIGVLHHIPDPEAAMKKAVSKLKRGGQFLVYIYYRMENRPRWYRTIWRCVDAGRRVVSRLPHPAKRAVASILAAGVYWPLARFGREGWPLCYYKDKSFYTMRTDALDRFGTRLELRFTKAEIEGMMVRCGLRDIRFSPTAPYWVALGLKG